MGGQVGVQVAKVDQVFCLFVLHRIPGFFSRRGAVNDVAALRVSVNCCGHAQ